MRGGGPNFVCSVPALTRALLCLHSDEGGPEAFEGGEGGPGEPDAAAVRHAGEPRGAAAGLHPQLRAAQKSTSTAASSGDAPSVLTMESQHITHWACSQWSHSTQRTEPAHNGVPTHSIKFN